MGIEYISFLMFGGMFFLMLLGVPLGTATGSIAATFLLTFVGPIGIPIIAERIYDFSTKYVLVALPFFVFMASMMERSGAAKDIYDVFELWLGRLRGGVAAVTIIVAMVLASMSGVIGGEVILLGMVAVPQMLRLGYDRNLAIGTVCAGGALGTMLPPSINLIIFGLVASVSVADLFAAAIIPGILLSGSYILYVLIRCHLQPSLAPGIANKHITPIRDKLMLSGKAALPIVVGASVLGSIYLGVASVTEAAAVGAFGMTVVAGIRGQLNMSAVYDASIQTVRTCGMVLWLIFGAVAFIGVYNLLGGPLFIKTVLTGLDVEPITIIVIICAIWVALGCVMEGQAICLLTVPIFAPIASTLGFNLIWLGVLFAMSCEIGYLSPPFGTAAFYFKGVAPPGVELEDIFRSFIPFIFVQLIVYAILIMFPAISLVFV